MRRWSKFCPFDFEQSSEDKWVLPFKLAVPKLELFCSIDDDNCVSGSSLVSRGLMNYPLTREFNCLKLKEEVLSSPRKTLLS